MQDFKFAHLKLLFWCKMPSGNEYDLALICPFKPSRWKPWTVWNQCKILDEGKPQIISLQYMIRSTLLVDVDLVWQQGEHFHIDDLIDNNMFLQMGN
jgi:hypothetical protein